MDELAIHTTAKVWPLNHISSHFSTFYKFFHYNKKPDYVLRMIIFFFLYPLLWVSKIVLKSKWLYKWLARLINSIANKQKFVTPFGTYICDTFDEYGRMNEQYEVHIKHVIEQNALAHPEKNKIFLNIGANAWRWLIDVVKNYDYEGIAFEPSAYTFDKLKNNCRLSDVSEKVKLYNYGLWQTEQKVEYYYNKLYPWSSFFLNENQIWDKDSWLFEKKILEIKSFDHMGFNQDILGRIRLALIDVEGFELDVLQGMHEFISMSPHLDVIIEVHQQSKQRYEINDIFQKYGYSRTQLWHADWLFRKE